MATNVHSIRQSADVLMMASSETAGRRACSLSFADWVWMAAGVALTLVISCVFGRHRIFWEDESLGWALLTDPSWRHMVHAWKLGADGGGFAFYVTGRLWFGLVGASVLTFRLYSAVCFGLAFCVTWIVTRRLYSTSIVAFAMFNTWFFCPPIVVHMAEGRFYGLLLLGTSLVLWITMKLASDPGPAAAYDYVLIFALNALLITSHLLGIVYSASLLVMFVLVDRIRGRCRPTLYLAAAASWLLLIPERTAIHASAQAGKPWFWTMPPTAKLFLEAYTAFSREIAAVLLVLVLGVALRLWRQRSSRSDLQAAFRAPQVYVVIFVLLLVPVEFVIAGHFGPSIFVSRYLIPMIFAQLFMTAEALQLLDVRSLLTRAASSHPMALAFMRVAAPVGFGALLLAGVFGSVRKGALGLSDDTNAVAARMPDSVPVLCEDATAFLAMTGPNPPKVQCTYLLDWAHSISQDAPKGEVSDFHLMQSRKEAGYSPGHIRYLDEFLKNEPEFLVLHDVVHLPPGEKPIEGNPLLERFSQSRQYQVEMYSKSVGTSDRPEGDLWLVCKDCCKGKEIPAHPAVASSITDRHSR